MTSPSIHPTAIIAETAKLGEGTRVGPYAIIGDHVETGAHCTIDAHTVLPSHVRMGNHNHLHPHTSIGGLPQDLGFDRDLDSWVEIGDHNEFRENVVISRASFEHKATRIGNHCYFMNNTHVGHDCIVGNHVILATGSAIGGHVQLEDRVFLGGGSMVHQYTRIGPYAMIAGVIAVRKDVLPYTLIGGTPVRHYRLNTIGLRRAGITGQRYKALSQAFRCLKNNQPLSDIPETEELSYLNQWLAADSKRGIYGFIESGDR